MERIKSINWKLVVYWFLMFSAINIYLIPKFGDHEPITSKKVIIGLIISAIVAIVMGFVASKTKEVK